MAQEAFLHVYRHAASYQPIASFKTWFYHILSNLCRNALKKHRPEYWEELPEVIGAQDQPLRDLERRELQQAIGRALVKLPPNQLR